jgi:hypothetical protein
MGSNAGLNCEVPQIRLPKRRIAPFAHLVRQRASPTWPPFPKMMRTLTPVAALRKDACSQTA